jgi:hypothetical protein
MGTCYATMQPTRWRSWHFDAPDDSGNRHRSGPAVKTTAEATKPPRLSDQNERRTFIVANQTVSQSPEKIVKYVATLESVIDAIEEREEQLYALATTILGHLSPKDEKNLPEGHPLTAWRLAQLLEEMLGNTSHRTFVQSLLLPA